MDSPQARHQSQASPVGIGHWDKASWGTCWDLQPTCGRRRLAPGWGWQWTLPRGPRVNHSSPFKPGRVGSPSPTTQPP